MMQLDRKQQLLSLNFKGFTLRNVDMLLYVYNLLDIVCRRLDLILYFDMPIIFNNKFKYCLQIFVCTNKLLCINDIYYG